MKTAERKSFTRYSGLLALTGNANIVSLLADGSGGISQGAAVNQRVGRRIRLDYIRILLTGYYPRMSQESSATVPAETDCRVIFILDKQSNGALPVVSDIFDTAADLGPGDVVQSLKDGEWQKLY